MYLDGVKQNFGFIVVVEVITNRLEKGRLVSKNRIN
jgi:hypothetical protein